MKIEKQIAKQTGTRASDWDAIDGPESGVGVEYWFRHRTTGDEAYVCVDQGETTIQVTPAS